MAQIHTDEMIYCSVYGAMMARQVCDYIESGRGAPDDDAIDRFTEEADAVALMALQSLERFIGKKQ